MSDDTKSTGRFAALLARHRAEEGELARASLAATGWRIKRAAAWLGIGSSTMQRILERHPVVEAERQSQMKARGGGGGSQ